MRIAAPTAVGTFVAISGSRWNRTSESARRLTRNSTDQCSRPRPLLRARARQRLRNARIGSRQATLLTSIQESSPELSYKRFASVSPDQSGHWPPSLRAPMLGGQPLSSKQTRSARLWIKRVLVRSQDGQFRRLRQTLAAVLNAPPVSWRLACPSARCANDSRYSSVTIARSTPVAFAIRATPRGPFRK